MRPARSPLLVLLALLLPLGASAFSVPGHEALTRAAIDAALRTGEYPQLAAHRATLVEASQAEDLNLHVKWTGWHHFYSPGATLDSSFRQGSSARVRALWEEAEEAASNGDLERAFDRVGHLAHHIQDMAVPLHVVPVMHGLSDRFEQYEPRQSLERRPPQREVAPLSGEEAQLALAMETLVLVHAGTLPAEGGTLPWSAFWLAPSKTGTFGGYGEAGNAFGAKQVRWQGRTWTVEPAVYEAFVDARVEAAVAYTRAFLIWATERLTTLAEARAHSLRPRWSPAPAFSLEAVGGAIITPFGSTPVAGARVLFPLPWAMALSVGYTRALGDSLSGGSGWSLGVLSPPLLTTRLGYSGGLDLRATVGAGLFSHDNTLHPGMPVGLRLHTLLGGRFSLSAEAQYRAFSPPTTPWARGATFTLGVGYTWGDN